MRPESFSLNPYEVLGVSPNASNQEIQAAYRQHALRWHPDRNPNDEYSMRMMQRVNAAWAILKDEDSRAAFDRQERGETRSASGPQAWRRPHADSPPGGEWYRPPPRVVTCPRCDSSNDEGSVYCYSCGYPFDEASQQDRSNSSERGHGPGYGTGDVSGFGRPGGFWVRLAAYLIDMACIYGLILVPFVFDLFRPGSYSAGSVAVSWMFLALVVLYFPVLVANWSTTLGKRIFGLYVVRTDGSKIGFCRSFTRYLCYNLSGLIFGIGFLMIAFSQDKRGLHDLICDTKVVYR